MPLIRIEYDKTKLKEGEAVDVSNAIQKIVSGVTGIEDVFVYTNSAEIKIKVAPIEIFVEMSAHKIKDPDELIAQIKAQLSEWKQSRSFPHPINLSLIPMNWKIEIGI
jgi:hypothetical protein